jgi:aspartate racemase
MIVATWEELLDTCPIGIHDDFYALGGDSLAAAQAIAELEVQLREPLPLLLLAESTATAAAITQLLRDRRNPVFGGAVPLQPQGSRPPLFCVGGGDGEVLELGPLGAALAPEQPFFALPGARQGAERRKRHVAAVAAHHLEQIRAVQASGPLWIGGYSAGGVTAFEMARQLGAAGTPPALVVLLDSLAPQAVRAQGKRQPLRERLAIGTRLRGLLFHLGAAAGLALPVAWRRGYRFERATRAVRAYRPGPYSGRVVLMRTMEDAGRLPRDLGWGPFAPKLEIVEIPGGHHSMLHSPHVQKVAEALRALV